MPFSWFGKKKDKAPTESRKPPTDSRSKNDFQEPMLRYAEQRLTAWLISKGGMTWRRKFLRMSSKRAASARRFFRIEFTCTT